MSVSSDGFQRGGDCAANQFDGVLSKDDKGANGSYISPKVAATSASTNSQEDIIFHSYEEYITHLAKTGFQVFRTVINWDRVFPTGVITEPDDKRMEFYDRVFDCCKRHGIDPLVIISHSELLQCSNQEHNGRESCELTKSYEDGCKVISERYKDKVKCWLT